MVVVTGAATVGAGAESVVLVGATTGAELGAGSGVTVVVTDGVLVSVVLGVGLTTGVSGIVFGVVVVVGTDTAGVGASGTTTGVSQGPGFFTQSPLLIL